MAPMTTLPPPPSVPHPLLTHHVVQKKRYGLPQQAVSDAHLASVMCEVEVFRKWRVVAVNLNRER